MSPFRLILNSLAFYWRTNLAVLLGVIAGAAVIGGALVVGDSVRESLSQISLKRLGGVDYAVESPRFFREDLAEEIAASEEFQESFDSIAPGMSLTAALQPADRKGRANQVGLWGVEERLWKLIGPESMNSPQDLDIILSLQTADELGVSVGDDVSVWVELPSAIPRGSLLGERDQTSRELTFQVSAILDGSTTADRFQLNPTQRLTLNAFVSLEEIQIALDLASVRRSPDYPQGRPARINALFVSSKMPQQAVHEEAESQSALLNTLLKDSLSLEDIQLKVRPIDERGYVTLESEQMILDATAEQAGRAAAQQLNVSISPVLVYLANELANAKDPEHYSMYSVLAGLDPSTLQKSPFGPMEMLSGEWPVDLQDDEIVLNDWVAEDLQIEPGDEVHIKWHVVGSHGELPEEEHTFKVRGIVKLTGAADDLGMTPKLPGITDVKTYGDWDQPFEMDFERLTDRDDLYWSGRESDIEAEKVKSYRATPKGFVSLSRAQELWKSRYGDLTSIRFAPQKSVAELDAYRDIVAEAVLEAYAPARAGISFRPVKYLGITAAKGTTDFSGLFIGFSFFLILSAMILISLLFRLGIERRVSGLGLLRAVGWPERQVRRQMLGESMVIIVLGSLLGVLAAIVYAEVIINALATRWVGAIGTSELFVSLQPLSLVTGGVISILVAFGAVWWSLRQLKGQSCRSMLSGSIAYADASAGSKWSRIVALSSGIVGALLLILVMTGLIPDVEAFAGLSMKAVMFFLVGMLGLTCSLASLSTWISRDKESAVEGVGTAALGHLSVRNAARNRSRTVMSTALISSATFVIAAVAAGQKNPAAEGPQIDSGNGGFRLVAETSQPILPDINTESGRSEVLDEAELPEGEKRDSIEAILKKTEIVSFRRRPGEDASCLNPYQTTLPTILGATKQMRDRGGFTFSGVSADKPWTLLEQDIEDVDGLPVYPVFGDLNTLEYSLHRRMGDRIPVPNAEYPRAWLEIRGIYTSSIFQGVLVASEEDFLELFPEQEGYGYFLIGAEAGSSQELSREEADELAGFLETGLSSYGFDTNRVADRLDAFLKVQNTYLKTFQTLGGLGLLLGTIGLGTVMLRNVIERRGELSLLRAVGFRNSSVGTLILLENAFLLGWGLLSGAAAALFSMLPHLLSVGAAVPWGSLSLLLAGVFVAGMLASLVAVVQAVRIPVLSSLRSE